MKTNQLSDGSIALGFVAPQKQDGHFWNPQKDSKPLSSAREFDAVPVRFWDKYWSQGGVDTLWYTKLVKNSKESVGSIAEYELTSKFVNALKGTSLVFPAYPTDGFGETSSFDIASTGILVVTRETHDNAAQKIVFGLYHLPLHTFEESPAPEPRQIAVPGYNGNVSAAVHSWNGYQAAFLMSKNGADIYEFKSLFIVSLIHEQYVTIQIRLMTANDDGKLWDYDPAQLMWSRNGRELYTTADDQGRHRLFKIPLGTFSSSATPVPLTHDGTVTAFATLSKSTSEHRLFVNRTSLVDSSIFELIDTTKRISKTLSSATKQGIEMGLDATNVSEVRFRGKGSSYDVQAFVVRPSSFSENKSYPLALMVHGGPVSSWSDSWSTRWNFAVFAEQGYVVVAPNILGSTGWGKEFTNVEGDWGGRPYQDIVNCFEYVERHMPYVDTTRAAALGASYGGYMMNWIAGQPLAKRLKTLVCHDGIFSTVDMMGSDLPSILKQDMGSELWGDIEAWRKYDPAAFTHEWTTPMLVIHSDNDFRCPITQGLSTFHVCKGRGLESRFLNFPDENHFVLGRENSLKWHRTVIGWINKYCNVQGGIALEPIFNG